jgi:S1-C subfamily serine protease
MPLLATHEPGDTIDLTVVRDGAEIIVPMTLKARRTTGG